MSPPRFVLVALLLLAGAVAPARAEPRPALDAERAAHADRLTTLAREAKDVRLGSVAVRLLEEALGLVPDLAAARLALGWTRTGGAWRLPANPIPGDGWPDDGEGELARIEKREDAVRSEHVRALVAAAAAAKAKSAAPSLVEELLWAAVTADPTDPAPRRALGHREIGGRWVAPEHAVFLAAGPGPTPADRATAGAPVELRPAPCPVKTIGGRADPVPDGFRAPSAGQVHALASSVDAAEAARGLERARRWLESALGEGTKGPAYGILVAGDLVSARALLVANGAGSAADLLAVLPAVPLGATRLVLVVGATPASLLDAVIAARIEGDVAARDTGKGGRWLGRALGVVGTLRLLGATHGFAASTTRYKQDKGPVRRPGEPFLAFARRLVVAQADPTLEEIGSRDDRSVTASDLLVGALTLDFLLRRDAASGRAWVSTYLATAGAPAERCAAAARAAGFPSSGAVTEAWRRFVADVAPVEDRTGVGGGAWKTVPLSPVKAPRAPVSLFAPLRRPALGSLLLGGREYLLAPSADGASLRAQGYALGDAPRVVAAPTTLPFSVAREYGGGAFDLRLALDKDGERWTVRREESVGGTLDGQALEVLDLDVDGRYGGFERDGLVVGGGRFAIPLPRELALGVRVHELRRVGPDGKELAVRTRPSAAKGADLEAFTALNERRLASGVPPLVFDAELARGCAAHAAYLAANHGPAATAADATREDPAKGGATPEGAAVAARCLAADEPGPAAAVLRWTASPRELAALLDPAARRGAIAFAQGIVVFSTAEPADEVASSFRGPLVWPADRVPYVTGLAGTDLVRADRSFEAAGRPFLVWIAPGRGEVRRIEVTPAQGAPLATRRIDGERWGRPGLVAFLPASPLAADVEHTLRIEASLDGVSADVVLRIVPRRK